MIAVFGEKHDMLRICPIARGYDSAIRRMQSWVCLLYNLYNTHGFILHITPGHTKNELMGVVKII